MRPKLHKAINHNTQRGFSVIEVVIVAAVVGVIAAMAIPSVTRTLQVRRLDSATSILASKLAEARMNAIKRNRQAWVAMDPTNGAMVVQTTDNAGNTINIGAVETLPTDVSISSPSAAAQVRFDSMGRLPTGTAAWALTLQGANNTRRKSIGVSAIGRVSVGNMVSYGESQ